MRLNTPLRLLATYGSAVLFLALIALANRAITLSRESTRWVEHTHEVVKTLETTLSHLRDAETGQRGFLLTGEPRYLEPYRAGTGRFARDLDSLQRMTRDNPRQQRRIGELRGLGEAKLAELAETVRLRQTAGVEASLAVVRTGRGKAQMDRIRALVGEMRAEEERLLARRRVDETRRRATVRWVLLGGGVAAGALALLINVLFFRHARAQQAAASEVESANRLLQERAALLEMQSGQLRRRAREEAALSEVARSLTTAFEVEEVLRRIAGGALLAAQARGAFVERVDPARTRVEVVAGAGEGIPPMGVAVPYPGSLAQDVLERDEPEWIPNVMHETRPIAEALQSSCGECAALVVPLISENDALGALILLQDAHRPPFRQDEITRARTLADLAAIALRRVLLYTEAERRREKLEESERRFRLLVDSVQEYAILMLDPDGRIASWNRGAERITGYTAQEAVGRPLSLFYTEEDRGAGGVEETLRTAAREGRAEEDAWRVRKDGSRFWAHVVINAIRDDDGDLLGFVDVVGDLTDRHRAEEARETYLQQERRARAEADAANVAKSQFLATMSHEIRTPINAIMGYTDLLEMELKGPLTEGQREQVERIQKSSEHLLGLVNDVLDLSKVEAGEMTVDSAPTPLRASARAALELIEPQAQAKEIATSDASECGPDVCYVGDEDRVRQVLLNLLSNAVKFTEPGGRITLRCGVTREAADGARLHGPGPWTTVEVSDTGVGIPADQRARVFEPFTQVEGGYTRRQGGTGLGLAISRRLARLMGGDLTLRSTEGEGSTFTLWLPATAASAEPADVLRWPDHAGEIPGLGEVGRIVAEGADELVQSLADRMRTDPAFPGADRLDRAQLEDHISTFMLDIGKSLVTLDESGGEPALMRDGSDIQRLISERHGDQRRRIGWSPEALRREFDLLRDGVEAYVRQKAPARTTAEVDLPIALLRRLLTRAEEIGLRSWVRP